MIESGQQWQKKIFVVTLGLVPPGLNIVRELGRSGVPVCGVAEKGLGEVGRFSKYLKTSIEYSDWNDLIRKLVDFGSKMKLKPVLIPTSDRYVYFIAEHYQLLSDLYTFQTSYRPATVAMTLDKKKLYQSLEEIGIPYPRTWFLDSDINTSVEQCKDYFPIIAKPRLIHQKKAFLGSMKVCTINSSDELALFRKKFHGELSDWMLQEIIPGPPSNLFMFLGYLNQKSRLLCQFTCRKLRQFPNNFGVGTMLVSERNEMIAHLSERYLRAIDYHGICEIEYKFDDRDGKYKMMDLNPRPPLFASLAASADVKINLYTYCDMTGQAYKETSLQLDRVVWRHLEFDMRGKIRSALGKDKEGGPSLRNGGVLPDDMIVKKTGPIWDSDDIRPALFLPLYHLRRGLTRLRNVSLKRRKENRSNPILTVR